MLQYQGKRKGYDESIIIINVITTKIRKRIRYYNKMN